MKKLINIQTFNGKGKTGRKLPKIKLVKNTQKRAKTYSTSLLGMLSSTYKNKWIKCLFEQIFVGFDLSSRHSEAL